MRVLGLFLCVLVASIIPAFAFNFGFGGFTDNQVHEHEHEHEHQDLYETLGLTMEATESEIKRAYRKLSLKYHPDKNPGDEDAHTKFHEISYAYEVLSDPQQRQVYDLEGFEGLEREERGGGQPSDPFSAFFGGGGGKPRGPDGSVDMPVTLEELYNGAQKEFRFARNVICRKCRGTGAKDGKTSKCKKCGGSGVVLVQQRMGPGFNVQMQQPCPKCGGKGKTFAHKCPFCGGGKVTREEKTLNVDIERGMPSSHAIVFERESNQEPGMIPGDIIINIHQTPHPRFRRSGDDLHYEINISLEEALLGYQKKMRHLDDRYITLSRAGITSPFEVRQIMDEGMPKHSVPSERGVLHIQHHIEFPRSISDQDKEFLSKLLD